MELLSDNLCMKKEGNQVVKESQNDAQESGSDQKDRQNVQKHKIKSEKYEQTLPSQFLNQFRKNSTPYKSAYMKEEENKNKKESINSSNQKEQRSDKIQDKNTINIFTEDTLNNYEQTNKDTRNASIFQPPQNDEEDNIRQQKSVTQKENQLSQNANSFKQCDTQKFTYKSFNFDIQEQQNQANQEVQQNNQFDQENDNGVVVEEETLFQTPQQIINQYSLSNFMKNEINQFEKIYFISLEEREKWTDKNGNYVVLRKSHICYRYEIISKLGEGAFGLLLKCIDHKTQQNVAIKVSNQNLTYIAEQEVKVLGLIKKKETSEQSHCVQYYEHFYFRNHLFIVMELLSTDLYQLLKKQDFDGFELDFVRDVSKQLLQSLNFMKSHKIIHCDIKPENICLQGDSATNVKIIDFGSALLEQDKLLLYVQSRYYRAPEILLERDFYDSQIDMWSFGCILAELVTGTPPFTGTNSQEQVWQIIESCGLPNINFLRTCAQIHQLFDSQGLPSYQNKYTINAKNRN